MKFRLELELENDAMKTAEDIENALTALVKSQRLTRYVGSNRIISKIDGAMILTKTATRPANGNSQGSFRRTERCIRPILGRCPPAGLSHGTRQLSDIFV